LALTPLKLSEEKVRRGTVHNVAGGMTFTARTLEGPKGRRAEAVRKKKYGIHTNSFELVS